jgi:hypothetical protein
MAVISKWGSGSKADAAPEAQDAQPVPVESTEAQLEQALEESDRRLRRLVRRLGEGHTKESEELDRELKGARRQLRANRELLGWEPSGESG